MEQEGNEEREQGEQESHEEREQQEAEAANESGDSEVCGVWAQAHNECWLKGFHSSNAKAKQ